ncbi:MAG: hypothetical protein LBP59_08290 [Planctomycetaceae bacterium]|jgi:hypothetical protein|nr:hypothetical protein [Planctomycetaceae bacterium]
MQARRPRSVGLVCISGSQAFRLGSFRFAGGTPAIRWSRLYFRIAQAFRLQKRNAGVKGSHSPQDRGRLACMRLYSTAVERGFDLKRFFVCLSAKCRRDICVLQILLQKNCPTCPSKKLSKRMSISKNSFFSKNVGGVSARCLIFLAAYLNK